MDRKQILATLREHGPTLKAAGLLHLRLFGSTLRNKQSDTSDIDLLHDLDPSRRFTLFDLGRLQYRLTETLGVEVDCASAAHLKHSISGPILSEAVVAF